MNTKCLHPYIKDGIALPCGQCPSCRSRHAREWTIRILNHGTTSVKGTCHMLNLTYDDDNLPIGSNGHPTLRHKDFQEMMHRLRQRYAGRKIQYFMCGEYGPKTLRPHYHAIIFGLTHQEMKDQFECKSYRPEHTHKTCWQKGHSLVGYSFTPETAQYVARYTLKKLKKCCYHADVTPPYLRCSQGIGLKYAIERKKQILAHGYISYQGNRYAIPRYYFKKWDIDRREFYMDYIEDADKRMIKLYDMEFPDEPYATSPYINGYMVFEDTCGQIKYYKGDDRYQLVEKMDALQNARIANNWVISKKFADWCYQFAVAHNAHITKKLKGEREKL